MKSVEILTANNISIQYESATVLSRGVALLIDILAMSVYSFIMIIIVSVIGASVGGSFFTILIYVFISLPIILYSLIMEFLLKGQTIGKLAMGIRVINLNGENAKIGDYLMRWTFRIVDFWFSFGAIAAIFISTTEKGQRIGDILAQTAVIKKNPVQKYTIHDILNIKDKSKHEPVYLGVTKFTDEDMLLVKNAISQYRKYPNDAHKNLVIQLADKVGEELNLSTPPEKKLTFLRDVLQDYIVLTR